EELSKVAYKLVDPEQYSGQRVLIVGGGDSAIEAAVSIADAGGREVTLSYRGSALARAKPKNRQRLDQAVAEQRVRLLLESELKLITPQSVAIDQGGELLEAANEAVIICAGGILPTALLEKIGIAIETKFGAA